MLLFADMPVLAMKVLPFMVEALLYNSGRLLLVRGALIDEVSSGVLFMESFANVRSVVWPV